MTISAILHNSFKATAILGLTAALTACSTFGHNKSENSEGVAKVEKVVAPTAEQETKNLPKGLLPDTAHAVHSAD